MYADLNLTPAPTRTTARIERDFLIAAIIRSERAIPGLGGAELKAEQQHLAALRKQLPAAVAAGQAEAERVYAQG